MSRFGVLRWMISDRGLDLPADVRPAFVAFQSHTATIQAVLAEFDGGVIVDEELLGYLVEIITVDTAILGGWREKIAVKGLEFPAW